MATDTEHDDDERRVALQLAAYRNADTEHDDDDERRVVLNETLAQQLRDLIHDVSGRIHAKRRATDDTDEHDS